MQRRALGASTAEYHLELLAARGTANATGGLINATRAGVPMLFSAGRTPLTEGSATGSRDATHLLNRVAA